MDDRLARWRMLGVVALWLALLPAAAAMTQVTPMPAVLELKIGDLTVGSSEWRMDMRGQDILLSEHTALSVSKWGYKYKLDATTETTLRSDLRHGSFVYKQAGTDGNVTITGETQDGAWHVTIATGKKRTGHTYPLGSGDAPLVLRSAFDLTVRGMLKDGAVFKRDILREDKGTVERMVVRVRAVNQGGRALFEVRTVLPDSETVEVMTPSGDTVSMRLPAWGVDGQPVAR